MYKITKLKTRKKDIIFTIKTKKEEIFMKKMVGIISAFLVLFLLILSINVYAESLSAVNVTVDNETVHPGETVTINISFGQDLGAYTVDVAYDNNLLEYVSASGGTASDNGTRVRVVFYDSTGGTSPRSSMSVTFRAKDGITTSNPTDLSVTAEGLANADASVNYDDISVPIDKSIVVEPIYVDYDISLNYSGDIIRDEEKDMQIVISSSMGKNYEHTRIIAEVTTQTGGTAKLLATDDKNLEHDIVQSGWGDASGDSIGGEDVVKQLDVRGLFSEAGEYAITLKLIDRDNSDEEIAKETFNITVKEDGTIEADDEEESSDTATDDNDTTDDTESSNTENNVDSDSESDEEPTTLPKTGNTNYFALLSIIGILIIAYIALKKEEY